MKSILEVCVFCSSGEWYLSKVGQMLLWESVAACSKRLLLCKKCKNSSADGMVRACSKAKYRSSMLALRSPIRMGIMLCFRDERIISLSCACVCCRKGVFLYCPSWAGGTYVHMIRSLVRCLVSRRTSIILSFQHVVF